MEMETRKMWCCVINNKITGQVKKHFSRLCCGSRIPDRFRAKLKTGQILNIRKRARFGTFSGHRKLSTYLSGQFQNKFRMHFFRRVYILYSDYFSVSGETNFAYLIYKNIPKLGFRQFRTYRKIHWAKCFGFWKIVSPETLDHLYTINVITVFCILWISK
jgi:hypothetical protein